MTQRVIETGLVWAAMIVIVAGVMFAISAALGV